MVRIYILDLDGAAICEMLKLHYKVIKECSNTQRNQLSQEITILKAMTMKEYQDGVYVFSRSKNYAGHQ